MSNLILVVLCFLLGYILKRSARFPHGSQKVLNGFVIHISLPALILYHIHRLQLSLEIIFMAFMPWLLFIVSFSIFWTIYKLGKIDRKTAGALILTSGFGNTSFVGLPLIQAYYGTEYLGMGILIDQVGTFLCLGVLGIVFALYAKEGEFKFNSIGKMILFFPPTQALVIAFLLRPLEYPTWLDAILLKLGDTITPVALVSVGLQLSLKEIRGRLNLLLSALGYKLIFAPILVYLIYKLFIGLEGGSLKIVVFEASMAPMVTSSILAMENDLKPELVALILGIGILLSFATTYLVYILLNI